MTVDWTELPPEILWSISEKLIDYIDYLHIRSVCHTWRNSVPPIPLHLPPQLPILLSHASLYNLLTRKLHSLKNQALDLSLRSRLRGSSHGWLIVLDESPQILLLNPLTRSKYHVLPPISSFPNVISFNFADVGRECAVRELNPNGHVSTHNLRYMRDSFVKKFILNSCPVRNPNFIAVAIVNHTNNLGFCRSRDGKWSFIEGTYSYCEDVVYWKGLFYAVDKFGRLVVCDLGDEPSSSSSPSLLPPRVSVLDMLRQFGGDMQYLVSVADELMLISRYLNIEFHDHQPRYRTVQFGVFKMDWSGPKWERVRSLGDYMVFIGGNSSFSLLATDYPGSTGNCIYFTDDYSESNYDGAFEDDSGIYNLADGSIEPLPCFPRNPHSPLHCPPPIWLSPNPCWLGFLSMCADSST